MRALVVAVLATVAWGPSAPAGAQPAPERRVSLDVRSAPLRQALAQLFQGTGLEYRVETGVPDVPVTVIARDVPLEFALRTLARAAAATAPGVSYARDGEGYLIRVEHRPRSPLVPAAAMRGRPVTLELQDASLRGAIHQLFRSAGVPYRLDAHVPDTPVTLHVRDAPFDTALSLLAGIAAVQVPDLTVEHQDGVYVFGVKFVPGQATEEHFPDPTDRRYSYAKLPVRFTSVAALSLMLGAPLLPTEADLPRGFGGGYGGGYGTSQPYGRNGYSGPGYGGYGYSPYSGGFTPRSLDFGGYAPFYR